MILYFSIKFYKKNRKNYFIRKKMWKASFAPSGKNQMEKDSAWTKVDFRSSMVNRKGYLHETVRIMEQWMGTFPHNQ